MVTMLINIAQVCVRTVCTLSPYIDLKWKIEPDTFHVFNVEGTLVRSSTTFIGYAANRKSDQFRDLLFQGLEPQKHRKM